jgi:hypothetical protein
VDGSGHLKLGLKFKGLMDDVRVWSTPLSASAIKSDSNLTAAAAQLKRVSNDHK